MLFNNFCFGFGSFEGCGIPIDRREIHELTGIRPARSAGRIVRGMNFRARDVVWTSRWRNDRSKSTQQKPLNGDPDFREIWKRSLRG